MASRVPRISSRRFGATSPRVLMVRGDFFEMKRTETIHVKISGAAHDALKLLHAGDQEQRCEATLAALFLEESLLGKAHVMTVAAEEKYRRLLMAKNSE